MPLLSDPPIRLLAKFQELFPSTSPQLILKAPGREMWAAANFNGKSEIAVWSAEIAAHTTFTYQSAKQKQTVQRRPLPHWARYLSGVSVYIDVPEMPGVDVVVGIEFEDAVVDGLRFGEKSGVRGLGEAELGDQGGHSKGTVDGIHEFLRPPVRERENRAGEATKSGIGGEKGDRLGSRRQAPRGGTGKPDYSNAGGAGMC